MVRSTPSTARTWPTVRLKTIPWVSGKCFFRPRISSSASPGGDVVRDAAVAPVVGSDTVDRSVPRKREVPPSTPRSAPGSFLAAMLPELSSDTEDLLAVVAGRLAARYDQAQ